MKRNKENFDRFISKLESQFPDLIKNEDLINAGLATGHTMLFRHRQSGELPFIRLSKMRIAYLKKDVLKWLRKIYFEKQRVIAGYVVKEKRPCKKNNKTYPRHV